MKEDWVIVLPIRWPSDLQLLYVTPKRYGGTCRARARGFTTKADAIAHKRTMNGTWRRFARCERR